MNQRAFREIVVVAAVTCFLMGASCMGTAGGTVGSGSPDFKTIADYGDQLGFRPAAEETVAYRELPLRQLDGRAVVATWQGGAPKPELVLIRTSSGWGATLGDKQLLRGWRKAILPLLQVSPDELEDPGVDPRQLATELTMLLVDPDPSLGRVVSSVDEIPLRHPLSDVVEDLRRKGLTEEEIDEMLREREPHQLTAPRFATGGESQVVEFYTWNLHGGLVVHWQITLGKKPKVESSLVMEGAGSYRRFFY